MTPFDVEQSLYRRTSADYQLLARSPGFADAWLPRAEEICQGFGEPPEGVRCPACVFAVPFWEDAVAVVQVTDQPGLMVRLLVLRLDLYAHWIGDPFQVAERFPPSWSARGELPTLAWPNEPPAPRSVADVQRVLQREDGPLLLGAVQALVDGCRLVFVRDRPDDALVRCLWMLLPTSLRGELWPAGFAFGNALGFHAVVVPVADPEEFEGYLTEEQAANYPEGRYELRLQIAAEVDDQRDLDVLFARRSARQTLRLGVFLLVLAVILLIVTYMLAALIAPRPA